MGKIREFDGLRGFLAVWVVFVHLLPTAGISPRSFGVFAPLFGEHLRVQVFSILSGFVIFLMMSRRRQGFTAFLTGRLLRIYPAYLLAFVLSVLMSPLVLRALQQAPFGSLRMADRLIILQNSLDQVSAHVVAHLTLLHGVIPQSLLPSAPYAFLGQGWNISTEFQFYLVAPFLFAGLARGPVWRRWLVAALCVVGWLVLRRWPNPASLAAYIPYFAVGMASFAVWRWDWSAVRWFSPALVVGLCLLCVLAGELAGAVWVSVLGWILLVRDKAQSRRPIAWLVSAPMQWLGGLSYSLYLLHMIPLYLAMYLLNGFGLGQGTYLAFLSGITFVLGLPMAWLSSVYVEQGLHRLAARSLVRGADPSVQRQFL